MRLDAHINSAEALGYLGYAGQPLDESFRQRFNRAQELVARLVSQGVYSVFPVDAFEKNAKGEPIAVYLKGTSLKLEGNTVVRQLQHAQEVALMVVTLGLESERLIRRETAVSATDGTLVDACASAYVESAAHEMAGIIARQAASRALCCGPRFSPGYGDFSLNVQPAFIESLNAQKLLGVSVTQGNTLIPSKSITAALGLFSRESFARVYPNSSSINSIHKRTCATCNQSDTCLLKSQGRTCYGSQSQNSTN